MTRTDPAGHEPTLVLEDFFQGRSTAWGMFQDRSGKIRRRFRIEAEGSWDPATSTLTLVEDFTYDDGETERRTWRIGKTGETRYEGTAGGVIGAARGEISESTLHWSYKFALKVKGRSFTVDFDDRLVLVGEDLLVNRAQLRKFGLRIGDVTCVFQKLPAAREQGLSWEKSAAVASMRA